MSTGSIGRASAFLASGTMVSRVMGFVRAIKTSSRTSHICNVDWTTAA